jgi:hypothetical protein
MKYPSGRNGVRGAVTPAQLARARMQAFNQAWTGPALSKQIFLRAPADYTADAGLFYITMDHNIHSSYYTWTAVKTDNSAGVIVENFHQGDDTLTLWFTDDTLTLAITIIG